MVSSPTSTSAAKATALQRLELLVNHSSTGGASKEVATQVLVLPDGGKVSVLFSARPGGSNTVILNSTPIISYTVTSRSLSFDIASLGTRYEGAATHIPKYCLLELSTPSTSSRSVSIPDLWSSIYALFQVFESQEHIPFTLTTIIPNKSELRTYLISTGLAREHPKLDSSSGVLFLSRAAFWQGAGTAGYHRRGWLPNPRPTFPSITAHTRNEKVIATHPLRPFKPNPGEVLYRKWCASVSDTIEFTHFDLDGEHDGSATVNNGGVSRHLAAFHKWHNDERVNNAWGERGSLEDHRKYVQGQMDDPHVLACMMSWGGQLFGYVEIVYAKEDHVGQHYPSDVPVGDWDRGIHILIGEDKFLGSGTGRSEMWIRSLVHYIFLVDPRTVKVIGEPNHANPAVLKLADKSGFHVATQFDFPYKRSALIVNPRENFFRVSKLA